MTPCTHDTLRRLPTLPVQYRCECGQDFAVESVERMTDDAIRARFRRMMGLTDDDQTQRDLADLARSDAA